MIQINVVHDFTIMWCITAMCVFMCDRTHSTIAHTIEIEYRKDKLQTIYDIWKLFFRMSLSSLHLVDR